jgi:chemotaxis protein CheC
MRFDALSDMQADALRETGNIGAGHAATALSQLVGHMVSIDVPTLEVLGVGEVPELFGGPEVLVVGVHIRLLGDMGGSMLFMIERSSALALVDLMHARPIGSARAFGPDEEALVSDVASTLASAYLAAVGRLANISLLPARASSTLDMSGAIMQTVTSDAAMRADVALLLKTRFYDADTSVDAYLFFLLDPASLGVLLGRLGVA